MRRMLPTLCLIALAAAPSAWAGDTLVTKKSPHTVATTLDRLEAALKKKGIAIAARWRHSAAAKKAGMSLRPTELLIFGNPKLGTPLMQSNQQIGLALPMKVLAYEDDKGQVWVAYTAPAALAAAYGITDRDEVVKQMTGALDKLTNQAIAK